MTPRLIEEVSDLSSSELNACKSLAIPVLCKCNQVAAHEVSNESMEALLDQVFIGWDSSKLPNKAISTPPVRDTFQELHHVGSYVRCDPGIDEEREAEKNAQYGIIPPRPPKRKAKANDGEPQGYYIKACPDFEERTLRFVYLDENGEPIDRAQSITWLPDCETKEGREMMAVEYWDRAEARRVCDFNKHLTVAVLQRQIVKWASGKLPEGCTDEGDRARDECFIKLELLADLRREQWEKDTRIMQMARDKGERVPETVP
ncbi:hypothetical protein LIA77_11860 [Sarocladium implicatum]|nr:hypothetical protein LIA77_11860 [Sarocladium implicatum]